MRLQGRLIKVLIVVAVTTAIALGAFTCGKKDAGEIRIGAVLPLTGDAAIYGEELRNGIELAVDLINSERGINGQPIRVVFQDDTGDAKTGLSALNKLIQVDKVPVIIGGAMSNVAASIAPVAQSNKIVLLSPTATAPSLSKIGDYFFRIWPSDNFDGAFMADFAYDSLEIYKVSIMFVNTDYGKGIEGVFKREFEIKGGKILLSEGYDLGATDFRSTLSKIKKLKPDAIYLPGYYKEIAGILRQAKELGIATRFLSVNSFMDPKILEIAGETAEGAIFTYPLYDPEDSETIVKSFVDKFQNKYGKKPDAFAAQGYDALNIVASAINKGGYTSREIQRALSQLKDFPGVTGTMNFDENGDVVKHLRIMTVRNGQFATIEN